MHQSIRDAENNEILINMAIKLWHPGNYQPDPTLQPVFITKSGEIVGKLNPQVVPETRSELTAMMKVVHGRGYRHPSDTPRPIDQNGNFDTSESMEQESA